MRRFWERGVRIAGEAIFPSNIYCMSCGSLIDETRSYALCDECIRKLNWIVGRTCVKCGKALEDTYRGDICYDCMTYEHSFSRGFSCLTYGLYERRLIFDYKYGGKGYMGYKFGDMLYDRISCEDEEFDIVIPVPISGKRLRKRGYNQSAVMGKRLAERMDADFDDDILIRIKETQRMRGLSPAEREAALSGAFRVRRHKAGRIEGKHVLLVDDIYTTGSTADACSEELLKSGAGEVFLMTLASGGNRKPNIE